MYGEKDLPLRRLFCVKATLYKKPAKAAGFLIIHILLQRLKKPSE
jgi:hypothetical protein